MIHRLYTTRREKITINGRSGEVFNRYDIDGLTPQQLEQCKYLVFAEPLTDEITSDLPRGDYVLGVEYLPGQYDQRADSAEQCVSLLLGFRPVIRTARIYVFNGEVDSEAVKKSLINPVEAREADLGEALTLRTDYPVPPDVETVKDYENLSGLAMSREDLAKCEEYFSAEGRLPTRTEIKVLDTYWSDHCRHTTFTTAIDSAEIHDDLVSEAFSRYKALRESLAYPDDRPITLMDIATIGAKYIDPPEAVHSEENNACTVRVNVGGESWLVLFKNETHNHPTEIEPFGGAATCIGGAIRDPLSGRGYVYQAMRLTGASDPSQPTRAGKLPQREIITKAAQGYSSYGNQIGIPTGLVDEVYHSGYSAKRMEVGAVVAAVPESAVKRESPKSGDVVLLLGGRTGRDGIGGATGSSVSHTASSLETCGAEVQKGNAPEERKLQRLFRNPAFTRLVKKCNDFGAGGVSVAVGELADGLDIDLDAVPLKYSGLDGTEIAVSESQERMAVVVAPEDAERVKSLALSENLEATVIASVNDSGRMRMTWRGKEIVNLSRRFIDSHGAPRHTKIFVPSPKPGTRTLPPYPELLGDLNVCSKRGLAERFDSTVGAHSVIMPYGGKTQRTPSQFMAAKLPTRHPDESPVCTLMAWGYDPYLSERSPYEGGYMAVVESLCKIVAGGGKISQCWLSLQEYFGRPDDPERWGKPFGALLGALSAQLDYGVSAIGGKDSMSGTFTDSDGVRLDVPPTLISFAVSMGNAERVITSEFKRAGSRVIMLEPEYDSRGLPVKESLLKIFADIERLNSEGRISACMAPTFGGVRAAVFKMCLGNDLGFEFTREVADDDKRGRFIIEAADDFTEYPELGRTTGTPDHEAARIYDAPLSEIFPTDSDRHKAIPDAEISTGLPRVHYSGTKAAPKFVIPVFPGTNCEYETARAIEASGGRAEIFVVKTLTPELMKRSSEEFAAVLKDSQALMIPGGFSNGDEPDGSGKFIAIFLRSPEVSSALEHMLGSGGLVCGICNGFQALVKTGLLPYGRITAPEDLKTTLTFNAIGRHQSRIVRTRINANNSPWLRKYEAGEVYSLPISHGEGRFLCSEDEYLRLMRSGQIAAQYVDGSGTPSMRTSDNPSGSDFAVECVTSPDGRILGRMGHAERVGAGLYKNVPGKYDLRFFASACEYFKG